MNIRCLKCKGRGHCGRPFCPVMTKISSQKSVNIEAKQDYFGATPNVFIGRYGYPNINVGLLNTEQYDHHDAPLHWSRENYEIPKIIDLRTQLINSSFKANIKNFNDRFLEVSQEVSLAAKPVDVEINLNKKPNFKLNMVQDAAPHGPNVKLEKARITENPKIPTKVDKVTSDTDLKAADAIKYLYKKGTDEHYLTKIISVGNLGIQKNRKLVPTRWSITAIDDTIGKQLITQVKQHKQYDYAAYFGGHLGNYYLILTFPEVWSYELFETAVGSTMSFATDYENYEGRKEYAHSTAGGYYAARLAILEHLKSIKRQGSVLALRFITKDYWAPLGVWVVREATRNSLKSKPIVFSSKELMLKYARAFIYKRFGMNLDGMLNQSKLLKEQKQQMRLVSFT